MLVTTRRVETGNLEVITAKDAHLSHPPTNYRKGKRTNVKTGCRTCKIRKLKCDEGRPACFRCVSTGRVCDGYGIWGGGGNFYADRQQLSSSVTSKPPAPISTIAVSAEEKQYFEWFTSRTAKTLPGVFVSTFWGTLVLQASVNEPAVLHAILTLSSVHNRRIPVQIDHEQQFMLQHYTKAISHLKPHFLNKDKTSVRIALITCVVFICLEALRGHFKMALTHLKNGLNVLREMQSLSDVNDDGILLLKASPNSIDGWIVEAFSRLHIQLLLLEQRYDHQWLILLDSRGPEPPNSPYRSLNDVWKQLERLLNQIFHLGKQARKHRVRERISPKHLPALLESQQHIRAELALWLDIYGASRKFLGEIDVVAGPLLYILHIMTSIMAETCLVANDESIFDSHTEQFVSLIGQTIALWKTGGQEIQPAYGLEIAGSIVDIGWIPPLYYTAIKCRVHRVRLQAIRLIETQSHKEGFWDSKIAACVARKVMEIEERDFYRNIDTNDDFLLSTSPTRRDLSLPILPQSYRIREVKLDPLDGPMITVILSYRQKQSDGNWTLLSKEYHEVSQCWMDGRTEQENMQGKWTD